MEKFCKNCYYSKRVTLDDKETFFCFYNPPRIFLMRSNNETQMLSCRPEIQPNDFCNYFKTMEAV